VLHGAEADLDICCPKAQWRTSGGGSYFKVGGGGTSRAEGRRIKVPKALSGRGVGKGVPLPAGEGP